MPVSYQVMKIHHYDLVKTLWLQSEGVGLSEADSYENIERYLEQNDGLSYVAFEDSDLIGAVLCGHDGRRGYIHHVAVAQPHRRQGIGRSLINLCINALKSAGIAKCHLFVFTDNENAKQFWERIGWMQRTDLNVMSCYT
jgi:ribosomal protein S18 acetylase RimI-like enzyme